MDTLVLERGQSSYLINCARLLDDEALTELAKTTQAGWAVDKSNPFIGWIAGDFVEADRPNSNTQFWTAGDLELSEYSIKYAPLNMVHKFRTPVGFFAATRTVKLDKKADQADQVELETTSEEDVVNTSSLKIQALSGMWTHIFPVEAESVQAASEEGLLFYSMECRGTHLICAGDNGCGKKFDYMQVATHCEHLMERSSIRHIVNPTFRGGALIVPPVRPGWKSAHAEILTTSVMAEAASYAEQNEAAFASLNADGVDVSAAGWEQLMASVVQLGRSQRV